MKVLTQINIKTTFLVVLLRKLFVLMIDLLNLFAVVYRGENVAYKFIKVIIKEYKYCRNTMNKDFQKI